MPIPVELYDESRTSLQASLAVEASRGARGAAASSAPKRASTTSPPRLLGATSGTAAGASVKPMRFTGKGGETKDANGETENGVEEVSK